jgi:uncharacterized protein (DUF4415 family)
MSRKPNPEMVDEENPEWTEEDFKRAVPFSELPESLQAKLMGLRRRGQRGKQKAPVKVPTTIRFDADVLAALKATGKGWQTRVNAMVKEWLAAHHADRRG